MDARQFDSLARSLTASGRRREVLAFLATIPLLGGLTALVATEDTAEAKGKGRRKRGKQARHDPGLSAEKKRKKKKKCKKPAQVCAGKCGPVTFKCKKRKKTVDCGSCACNPPCDECFLCNETTRVCEVDPEKEGDACGQTGQFCHADGACICDDTSCPACAICQGDGSCTEPCAGDGCCDNGACLGGNTVEACGSDGETCAACSGSEPICVNGTCTACSGANPCPAGRVCVGGSCELCDVCTGGSCDFTSVQDAITASPAFALIAICPGTYGKVTVNKPLVLIGAGDGANAASNTILDAAGSGTVVDIDGSVTATLHSLRITGGDGADGGGVQNLSGDLTITRCTVIENETSSSGGGIYNGGTLTMIESTIAGNTAEIVGGGLENSSGTASLFGCSVTGNSAQGGGGIDNFQSGTILIDNTTVTGNSATSPANLGGGIRNDGSTVTLQNGSTVSGNTPNNCVGAISGSGCGA
jgi:hypothetical protein